MRYLLYCMCSLLLAVPGKSQVGIGTIFIAAGTTFTADSLVLIPTVGITINTNTLTHGYTPMPGATPGTNSIARVYDFAASITYSGEVGIIYSDAELAGNTETLLQIATRNGTWTTTSTSTVNTGTNYVSYQAAGLTFDRVTATSAGVALPIIYSGFSATAKELYVLLNWQMADIDGLNTFDVEYSNDGRNWSLASSITPTPGSKSFSYQHNDMNFTTRYYRVAGVDYSGDRVYSRIVTVHNNNAASSLRVMRSGSNTLLYFSGSAPTTVQVYDMKGQLLQTRNVASQQCEINGLIPGTYVIHYVVDGQKLSRKIQL